MTQLTGLAAVGNGLRANDGTGNTLQLGAALINANWTAIAAAVNALAAAQSAGGISYPTKVQMLADLSPKDGTVALVWNDATPANNQTWIKVGAPGTGTWSAAIDRLAQILGNGAGFQAAGDGAVVRPFQEKNRDVISIKDYGAKGDGATDDTAAIQKAVNAAAGRTLFVNAGRYLVSAATGHAAITLPAAGIRIVGEGRFNSVFAATAACGFLVGINADKVEIQDVGFDGSQTARLPWQRSIVLRGVLHSTVENCWFYRLGDCAVLIGKQGFGGSDAYGEGTRQSERNRVIGNLIESCWGTVAVLTKYVGSKDTVVVGNTFKNSCTMAISIESEASAATEYADRIVVTGNIVNGCSYAYSSGFSPVSYGISVSERARSVVVQGNVVDGVAGSTLAAGILISTSPSQSDTEVVDCVTSGNTISNVTCSSGHAHGILLQAGNTSIKGFPIVGNTIRACGPGISFDLASATATNGYIDDAVVTGNVISDCLEFGIWSITVSGSGEIAMRRALINSNIVTNSGNHGIQVKLQYGSIVGNKVSGAGAIGISTLAGSTGNLVSANSVTGCASDGIQLAGDRTLLTGNVCMNNGQNGSVSYGIQVTAGSNVAVIGNRCGDDQTTATQDYGVRAPNGSTVRMNEVVGNTTGGIWGSLASYNTGTYDAALNRTA